ncbi:hypothetical protein D3C87_1091320 [compost metagenome]
MTASFSYGSKSSCLTKATRTINFPALSGQTFLSDHTIARSRKFNQIKSTKKPAISGLSYMSSRPSLFLTGTSYWSFAIRVILFWLIFSWRTRQ